jgi:hypothetical protein
MTITRANVEEVLIRRAGKLMAAADLDGASYHGANADLNDPIGWALRQMEYAVASLVNVADSDLASVTDADIDQLLDMAEYRLMENVEGNFDDVDISANGRSERLSQLMEQVTKRLERLKTKIETVYGLGLGTLDAGVIALDFIEKDEADE